LLLVVACVLPPAAGGCWATVAHVAHNVILPEQRDIAVRHPDQLPPARLPDTPAPRTVTDPQPGTADWPLSLDEAIKIALANGRVIRSLAGLSVAASGQTIYDAAIVNTTIDVEQARFDPVLGHQSIWNRIESPGPVPDPTNPLNTIIDGQATNSYLPQLTLNQTNVFGGQASIKWNNADTRFTNLGPFITPFALNPQNTGTFELAYTQPLLLGAGFAVNTAPIVIARLDTERSFFQLKDSVQELVRGVIEAYWNLVQARVVVWAREIQVEQSGEAYRRERARLKSGLADLSNEAQARVTYNQFRASLIAARADVLNREAALRNLLFLPPNDHRQIVPVSAPASRRYPRDWDALVHIAEQRRPDIVELKLILQADEVRQLQAQNRTLPQLDAMAAYDWNGLSGVAPNGDFVATRAGQFGSWTLGINFSVPLGLRQARAQLRQQTLIIARDRANIDNSLNEAVHAVAAVLRDIDSAYEQYLAYKETRAAARDNLVVQIEQFRAHRTIYLNVLTALNDWGNAVTSEAQALISYNNALAALERQTGTILETHGLVFWEERFRAAGPVRFCDRLYPEATPATGTPHHYPPSGRPSEEAFELTKPQISDREPEKTEQLPAPRPLPPAAPGPR
jgi:outer membrane protein TolC